MRAWTTLGLSTIGLLVAHGDAHGDPAATASHPDAAAYFHQFPTAKAASDFPVGLWHLDDVAYATSASHLGAALKPGGAATPAALTQVPGATRVPANGYFIVDHGLVADAQSTVNRYSLVLDLSVPRLGEWIGLYNTDSGVTNDAEAWIDPTGKLGQSTYSAFKLKPDTLYRVIISVDAVAGTQRFYVNGQFVHESAAGAAGGRFSLGAGPKWPARFAVLGTKDRTPAVDLRRVALFAFAVGDAQAKALGDWTAPISNGKPSAVPRHRFKIDFDYRFAGGYFDDPARRKALEGAAQLWGDVITSDFPTLPKGTKVRAWDPATQTTGDVVLDHDVDDYVMFVYAIPKDTGNKAAAGSLGYWTVGGETDRRWNGARFRPWVGQITVNSTPMRPWYFDTTPYTSDDIPVATHYDFIATAVHEIGHALGFITSSIDARKLANSNHEFIGPFARLRNGGAPLLLAAGHGHMSVDFLPGVLRPHMEVHTMAGHDLIQGWRTYPMTLDLAALEDLGYDVDHSSVFSDPFYGPKTHPDAAAYLKKHPDARSNPAYPVGLWHLDSRDLASSTAILGAPLKYRPATLDKASGTIAALAPAPGGGVRVPRGSTFAATFDLKPAKGEKCINRYSLVLDVRAPKFGDWIPLYTTSTTLGSSALGYIDPKGKVGNKQQLASKPLAADTWHRVVITVDNAAREQRFYVDGALAAVNATQGLDDRYSIGVVPAYDQWFFLFGDKATFASEIDVKRAALYGYTLRAEQVKALGAAGGEIAAP